MISVYQTAGGFAITDLTKKTRSFCEFFGWLSVVIGGAEESGKAFAQVYIAGIVADAPFVNAVPSADGLERDTEFRGKLVLCHVGGAAEIAEILSDVQFHDGSLSL